MSLFKKDISKKELEKAFNEIQMNLEIIIKIWR